MPDSESESNGFALGYLEKDEIEPTLATLAEYRHRGLQRRLAEEFHKQASQQEYNLCAIEGIPYFYRQFGYEYALPLLEETKINLNQIPDYESNIAFRVFTEEDIPKATQLLAQPQKKFYVHITRGEQIWKMQHETGTTEPSISSALEKAWFRN